MTIFANKLTNGLKSCFCLSHGLFDVVVIGLTTLLLSFADLSILDATRLLDNFTGNDNRFSTKTFYQIKNRDYNGNDMPAQIFALVDVKDVRTRTGIAAVIDSVYRLEPQKIAVDIMFETPQDNLADSVLVNTVERVRDKAVFVSMLEDYDEQSQSFREMRHSFFLDPNQKEWFVDNIEEGFANLKNNNNNETIWLYSLVEQCGKYRVYSLPAALLSNYPDEQPHTEHIINYDKINIPVYRFDNLCRDSIAGKLVIIGDYTEGGDLSDTPLGMLPGMMVHTYIMQSEQTDAIIKISPIHNTLLTVVVLLLFVIMLVGLDLLARNVSVTWLAVVLQGGFPTIVVTVLSVYLFMRYDYYLFADDGIFCDGHITLNGLLIASALVKTLYTNAVEALQHYKKAKWLTSKSIYGQIEKP